MANGRVMIVEDESLVAEDLHHSVAGFGYEVVGVADTFESAAALAERARPDLALLDIRLKGQRDGIELAVELRRRQIGFVYLTSHADAGTLARAEVTEPLGYVLKPFGSREVFPVLQTAMYRHHAEQRLRAMEQWLRTTLRSIGDAVVVTDELGKITYCNPVAEAMLGVALRELSGRDFEDVVRVVDAANHVPVPSVVRRCLDSSAVVRLDPDTELVRDDGSRLPVDDCAAPVRDEHGVITGTVVVMRDATPQREVERRRLEAERRMQEAARLESVALLATGLAHDLNNALTVILGNLAVVREGGFDGDPQPLREIESSARTAAEMCRRMLQGVRATPPAPRSVDVGELLSSCVADQRAADPFGPAVALELERAQLSALADPLQLRQVVQNLLRNAAEALQPHGGQIVVRAGAIQLPSPLLGGRRAVSGLSPGPHVWIEVADDGPGMAPDVMARVFEPFFTTKLRGSGLGLASAHAITRRHGGAIEVESECNVGTLFRLFWPAAPNAPVPAPAPPAAEPLTVLVLDEQPLRLLTCRQLRSRGYRCHAAARWSDAVATLHQDRSITALIVDFDAAGAGFAAALRELRRERPELAVLLLTARADVGEALVNDPRLAVLAKPFVAEELVERLRLAVQRAQPTP